MWFPPYPAPSIARSALPDAPVRVDPHRDDPIRRPAPALMWFRRWLVGTERYRPVHRQAAPGRPDRRWST